MNKWMDRTFVFVYPNRHFHEQAGEQAPLLSLDLLSYIDVAVATCYTEDHKNNEPLQ